MVAMEIVIILVMAMLACVASLNNDISTGKS